MEFDITALAAQAGPSVLGVSSGRRSGTGTVIAPDTIVTTAHNIAHHDVWITMADGSRVKGNVLAATDEFDLAVIQAELAGVEPLSWAAQPNARATWPFVGQEVLAIAAPGGTPRTTLGRVATSDGRLHTRTGSPVADIIEHTAALVRGASGGPILDSDGRVLGLNVNRLEGGLYQAIAVGPDVISLIEGLGRGEVPRRARLGVTLVSSRHAAALRQAVGLPVADGVLVDSVEDDSPAGSAGIARGDLLIQAGDHTLRRHDDLLLALRTSAAQLLLEVQRGGAERRSVTVELG